MSIFFKPYEGSRPFLFISYAHKQSDAVVDTIRILHEKGYRLWYDEGIPAGSDWPANIAQHMQGCEKVVFFLSERAMESPNCFSEIRTAFRAGKPILVVRLENVEATNPDWQELLAGKQVIPLLNSPEERAAAILNTGFVTRRFRRSRLEGVSWRVLGLAASLLFFLAAASALGLLASGRWSPLRAPEIFGENPAPTPAPAAPPVVEIGEAERYFAVSFPDKQQERAIRRALNKQTEEIYRWQLAEIPELYFCGNMVTDSLDPVRFDADGTCRVNGAPVVTGQVSDLSLIANAGKLEKLALVCQPEIKLSDLNGHLLLRELSLAGSPVSDLSALQELPSLETLHLEHTSVSDLTTLEAFPNLRTVTVSRGMLPLRWNDRAGFAVVLVE